MLSRRSFVLSAGAVVTPWPAFTKDAPMSGRATTALLARTLDGAHVSTGMVAGVCGSGGQRVLSYGTSDAINGRALDGNTVFDIGSLTKLFTALTLADMVVRGEMAMSDPLSKYLPADVHVPDFAGQPIRLLDVVTYSSGLPEWPADMPPLSAEKPFPDYSVDRLYQALSRVRLDAAPGTHYVYANFGYGLLGLALTWRAAMDFESLIVSRICNPLGMDSTRITLTPELLKRVSPGHDQKLATVTSWNLPAAFAGAGAFRSTTNDLLRFLAVAMGIKRSRLTPAFAEMMKTQRPADKPNKQAAAGWFITSAHSDHLIWKDGGVLGYSSFIGYSATHRRGAVIWTNGNTDLVNLGWHLINTDFQFRAKTAT